MSSSQRIAVWSGLVLCCASLWSLPCRAADLQEIIRRGTDTIQSDWAADEDYAHVERDEVQKDHKLTSRTYRVVMMAGSYYYLPLAANDQQLSTDQEKTELEKLKNELQRRDSESPSARRRRIGNYRKQRDENGALLLEFPKAFALEMLREETMNGYPAYVLSATPRKRTGHMSRAAKVLSGMRGTLWIDKETFHVIRGEGNVVTPVPIYGILARVVPGTHISIEMAPVTDTTWLISKLEMTLAVSKFFWFKSTQVTRSTYFEYRLNSAVLDELISKGGQ